MYNTHPQVLTLTLPIWILPCSRTSCERLSYRLRRKGGHTERKKNIRPQSYCFSTGQKKKTEVKNNYIIEMDIITSDSQKMLSHATKLVNVALKIEIPSESRWKQAQVVLSLVHVPSGYPEWRKCLISVFLCTVTLAHGNLLKWVHVVSWCAEVKTKHPRNHPSFLQIHSSMSVY